MGRWITDPEELGAFAPQAPTLPVDVTFILEGKDASRLPGVVKGDCQKADNAATLTHLWSFFFRESFLARFQEGRGPSRAWQARSLDPYRRHRWDRRNGMPQGWEKAMDGVRRLGLRWWRRNLF